jgi:hypothetical protein
MTEHPTELLLQLADGAVPPDGARDHLAACRRCQQTLAALAPLDLDYVWQGVAAELDAPRPGLLERGLVAAGLPPGLARFTAATPSLRAGWLLANLLVLVLVALPLAMAPAGGWPSGVLVVAPLVAAAAVAFAYGPVADPAYELVATTPTSPLRALLVRLAAVLAANSVLAGAIDLATAGDGSPGGWLLPMTSAALLAVVVASRSAPMVGALAGMGAWLLVLGAWAASDQPAARLTAPSAQAAYATVAAVLLALLVRSTAGRGWPPPGVGWESPS